MEQNITDISYWTVCSPQSEIKIQTDPHPDAGSAAQKASLVFFILKLFIKTRENAEFGSVPVFLNVGFFSRIRLEKASCCLLEE